MTTRIACAGISGRILQGRVSADRLSFTGQTKDVTSDVLAAVIDKLKHHGGSFTINCDGKPIATLTLSAPTEQQQGGEAVEVVGYHNQISKDWSYVGRVGWEPLMTVAQHQRILAASVGSGEAVAQVSIDADGSNRRLTWYSTKAMQETPVWTKLYTSPAANVPVGCVVVPVDRIAIALEAVQNAMEDAYNNAYQDCCGRGQGECCGNPIAAWSDADTAIMDALAPAQRELSALLASAEGVKDE